MASKKAISIADIANYVYDFPDDSPGGLTDEFSSDKEDFTDSDDEVSNTFVLI